LIGVLFSNNFKHLTINSIHIKELATRTDTLHYTELAFKQCISMYLINQRILQRASFLEAHVIGSSSNVEPRAKPLIWQHRQQIKHFSRMTPYNGNKLYTTVSKLYYHCELELKLDGEAHLNP
jgi:hypothetical protein